MVAMDPHRLHVILTAILFLGLLVCYTGSGGSSKEIHIRPGR
jgi:hypothetical protein